MQLTPFQWSSSVHLTKAETGFRGTAKIPWGERVSYKFIVDGIWLPHQDQPTETDEGGNVNNVYTAPPKPSVEPTVVDTHPAHDVSPDVSEPVNGSAKSAVNGTPENGTAATLAPVADAAAQFVDQINPEITEETVTSKTPNGKPMTEAVGTTFQLVSDLASTIAAREGTTSTFDYVASGLGAAIHGVVGIDPINADKIAVETPKPGAEFVVPEPTGPAVEEPPVPEPQASPIAPIVPIAIIPVNAAENNLTPVETPKDEAHSTSDQPQEEVSAPPLSSPPTTEPSVLVETAAEIIPQPSTAVPVSEPEPPIIVDLVAAPQASETAELPPVADVTSIPADVPPEIFSPPAVVEAEPTPAVTEAEAEAASDDAKPETTAISFDLTSPAEVPPNETPSATVLETEPIVAPEPEADAPTVPKVEENSAVSSGAPSSEPAEAPVTESAAAPSTSTLSAPSTPAKNNQHAFPSSDSPASTTNNDSPSSSPKYNSTGSRKKRTSIFGKISLKGIFGHDKEKK